VCHMFVRCRSKTPASLRQDEWETVKAWAQRRSKLKRKISGQARGECRVNIDDLSKGKVMDGLDPMPLKI